jgi:hypothetical protein
MGMDWIRLDGIGWDWIGLDWMGSDGMGWNSALSEYGFLHKNNPTFPYNSLELWFLALSPNHKTTFAATL